MRLLYYAYSQAGYYFVTICTYNKIPMLSDIENGVLNKIGEIAHKTWLDLPKHYAAIDLDES
jgi:putative transposase